MANQSESQSFECIKAMERMLAEVPATFIRTDAVIASFGLSREQLAPLLKKQRTRLSEADRSKLDTMEHEWHHALEAELSSAKKSTHKRSSTRKIMGMRLGLLSRI